MNNRRRIVVVGGGPAGLSTALSLTDPKLHPNWQDEYEVTVLQLGWRAGGKGATGRRGDAVLAADGDWTLIGDARVEEHGIHLFGNMYVNALRLLDRSLGELQRSPGEPVTTITDDLTPSNTIQLADYYDRRWHVTSQPLPHNNLQPWATQDYPGPLVLIRELLRLAGDLIDEVLGIGDHGVHGIHIGEHLRELRALFLRHEHHPSLPNRADHGEALERLAATAASMKARLDMTDAGDDLHDRIRSVWCQIDMYATVGRGVVDDKIFQLGIDTVDGEDFRAWCARHGMAAEVLNSAPVMLPAEMCFQFPDGDTGRPPLFSAAGFLWFTLRQILACGQATYWFRRGTGDTVVAPLYRVAAQRGVQFRFFNKVTNVSYDAATNSVDTIEIDIQATTVDGGPYEPLVRLSDGTWAWPNRPIYGQLQQGEELRLRGIDLESWWNGWPAVGTETLTVGVDFDEVVLAVPLPCLPLIAPELVAVAGWTPAVDGLGGLETMAAQFWTNVDSAALGLPTLPGTDRVCSGAAVPPLGIADMTQVIAAEQWDPAAGQVPQGLYYVCGPLQHGSTWAGFDRTDTPAIALERARTTLVQWLKTAVSVFPAAGTDGVIPEAFDFDLLWCPPGSDAYGEARVNMQYVRANIDPNERYVPSPPGTAPLRPKAWDSGITNLALASDWIFTGINIGSFEGAVMSGLLAAHARTGLPLLKDIVGYDFARPGQTDR